MLARVVRNGERFHIETPECNKRQPEYQNEPDEL